MDCWICGEPGGESCSAPHAACETCISEAGGCPTCLRITASIVCRQDTEVRTEESLLEEQATVQMLLDNFREREVEHEAIEARVSSAVRGFYVKPGLLEIPVTIRTTVDVEPRKANKKLKRLVPIKDVVITRELNHIVSINPLGKRYQLVGGPDTWPPIGNFREGYYASLKSICGQTLYYQLSNFSLAVVDNLKKEIMFCWFPGISRLNTVFMRVQTPFHGAIISKSGCPVRSHTKTFCGPKCLDCKFDEIIITNFSKGTQTRYLYPPNNCEEEEIWLFKNGIIQTSNLRLDVGNLDAPIARGTMFSSFRKQLEYRLDEIDLAMRYQLKTTPLYLGKMLKDVSRDFDIHFGKEEDKTIVWETVGESVANENEPSLFVAVCKTLSAPFDFYMRLTNSDGSGKECYYRCYDYEPALDVSSRTRLIGERLSCTYGKIVVLGGKNPRTYVANEIGELRTRPVPKLV